MCIYISKMIYILHTLVLIRYHTNSTIHRSPNTLTSFNIHRFPFFTHRFNFLSFSFINMDWIAKIGSDIEQVVGQSPTFTDWWLSPNSIEPYKELRFCAEKPERHLACLEHHVNTEWIRTLWLAEMTRLTYENKLLTSLLPNPYLAYLRKIGICGSKILSNFLKFFLNYLKCVCYCYLSMGMKKIPYYLYTCIFIHNLFFLFLPLYIYTLKNTSKKFTRKYGF
jgi:hypothetical protein